MKREYLPVTLIAKAHLIPTVDRWIGPLVADFYVDQDWGVTYKIEWKVSHTTTIEGAMIECPWGSFHRPLNRRTVYKGDNLAVRGEIIMMGIS